MAGTHQSFTPAASTTFTGTGTIPTPIALPAVDSGNPAVMLQNLGPGTIFVFAGKSNGGPIANAPGAIALQEGETQMFATHAGLGGSTVATMHSQSGGGRLQFSRGSVTPLWLFPAAAVAVI